MQTKETTPAPQNKQQATVAYLETLDYKKLADAPILQEKFVQLYNSIHGSNRGLLEFEREKFNFLKAISEDPKLQQATSLSLYSTFLDIAVMGLSVEKGSKPTAYIFSRNAKIKKDGRDAWETRAYLTVSPYGELKMRMDAGHIKYADNPVIVYEGDTICVGLNSQGKQTVMGYEAQIPRKKDAHIIGGFIRIERHDGTFEIPWVDIAEMDRLAEYSKKNNSKWVDDGSGKKRKEEGQANALYTSNNGQIDSGFFAAKIIKHAFASYPKLRAGKTTVFETEVNHNEQQQIDHTQHAVAITEKTESDAPGKEEEAFGSHVTEATVIESKGVKVETSKEDGETF